MEHHPGATDRGRIGPEYAPLGAYGLSGEDGKDGKDGKES
jgi:hypothetical protein